MHAEFQKKKNHKTQYIHWCWILEYRDAQVLAGAKVNVVLKDAAVVVPNGALFGVYVVRVVA